jgi:hypothetical protein
MIWLTWRQFRVSALAVLVALLAAAVALAVTGPQLADLLTAAGDDFFDRLALEDAQKALFLIGTALAYVVPAVVGAFWGAPLVARELEAGTHRLVWNQSITRTRWLATKFAALGLGAALAGLIGLAMTWWSRPLDKAVARGLTDNGALSVPRIWPDFFGSRGVVPIGMAVLALTIGVAAGLLVKRTVPAMAVTLVAIVVVQIAMPVLVQRHLVAPETVTTEITAENLRGLMMAGEPGAPDPKVGQIRIAIDAPGAWITVNRTIDPDGQAVEFLPAWAEGCAAMPGRDPATSEACFTRLAEAGYHQHVEYLPASRYWALQWTETAILLAAALGLAGFCFWRIRGDF